MSDLTKSIVFSDLYALPSRNGVSYPSRLRGEGIPMVNMREIFTFDRIGSQEMERVPLTEKERRDNLLQEGDLLFARQSLVREGAGRVVYVEQGPDRTWESHIIRVRLNRDRAVPKYFYYFFRSREGRALIETIVEQVAASGIRASDLGRLEVAVPPIHVQGAIAAVLGALDDKLDHNSHTSKLAETRLAKIFAAYSFDVPDGQSRLDDIIQVAPVRKRPIGDSAPYIDMASIPTESALVARAAIREPKSGSRFMNGDTVMARITPCLENGKVAFIDCLKDSQVGLGSTEFIVLRPFADLPLQFAYFLARSERFRDYAVRHMSGSSGRQRCPTEAIARYAIKAPQRADASAFADEAVPTFRMLRSSLDESGVLVRLRDALLPKLLSGEVRIHDAESLVEASL